MVTTTVAMLPALPAGADRARGAAGRRTGDCDGLGAGDVADGVESRELHLGVGGRVAVRREAGHTDTLTCGVLDLGARVDSEPELDGSEDQHDDYWHNDRKLDRRGSSVAPSAQHP
jgi:hypothetical protein